AAQLPPVGRFSVPPAMRYSLRIVLAAVALVALVACGNDPTRGPVGEPTEIVQAAPGRTVAQGTARVQVAIRNAVGTGTVNLRTGAADVKIEPPGQTAPEFARPTLAIDVVRNAVSIVPYGGAEVRGASTIKYQLD